MFAINGITGAAILPRLVDVQQSLGIDDAALGAALAIGAMGGLAVGPVAGPLVSRWGSARVTVGALLSYAPLLFLPAVAPGTVTLGLSLFWVLAGDAVMDAAMNAHGIRVQAGYGRSILNSFHGFWSVGAVVGGALGAASAALQVPLAPFLLAVGLSACVAGLVAARSLLPGPDPHSHLVDGDGAAAAGADGHGGPTVRARAATRPLVLLGLFILLAVVVEDVPARWSSVYMASIGAAAGAVGLAYVAFAAAQTLGRFLADRVIDVYGQVVVVRVAMVAVAVGYGVGLLVGGPVAFVLASALVGLGVAPLFPAALLAAAHLPGVRPATGVAVVSWLARIGFVVAPLAVGVLAESAGLVWGMATTVLAAVLLVPLAVVLRAGESGTAHGRAAGRGDARSDRG